MVSASLHSCCTMSGPATVSSTSTSLLDSSGQIHSSALVTPIRWITDTFPDLISLSWLVLSLLSPACRHERQMRTLRSRWMLHWSMMLLYTNNSHVLSWLCSRRETGNVSWIWCSFLSSSLCSGTVTHVTHNEEIVHYHQMLAVIKWSCLQNCCRKQVNARKQVKAVGGGSERPMGKLCFDNQ